jgi:hypothetical protein
MNNFPSRRERKALAKQFGLVKKKETLKEWYARTSRSIELGKQIHLYNLQQQENARLNPDQKEEEHFSDLFSQSFVETAEEPIEETIETPLEETPKASTETAVTVEAGKTQPIGE